MAEPNQETQVQDQGGFEGRRRQVHQDGFEGRYKQVPPMVKEAKPEERPPDERPPAGVVELLKAIVEAQRVMIEQLQTLIKASETELVDLKFDTGIHTLTNAVAAEPDTGDISATGYTQELVATILQRTSPELYLINLGPGLIYARISKGSAPSDFSLETAVFEGTTRVFYDVFEVRLRSPVAGTQYILTEYEPTNPAKTFFTTKSTTLNNWAVSVSGLNYEYKKIIDMNSVDDLPIHNDLVDGLQVSKISLYFANANVKDINIDFILGGFPIEVYERQYSVTGETARSIVIVFGEDYQYAQMSSIRITTANGTPGNFTYAIVTLKRVTG